MSCGRNMPDCVNSSKQPVWEKQRKEESGESGR